MTIFKNKNQKRFFVVSTTLTFAFSTAGFLIGIHSTWSGLINFFGVEGNNLDLASLPFALASLGVGLFGWLVGIIVSLFLIRTLAQKWSSELGEEKTKLTCLSFLLFLVLLAILILVVSRSTSSYFSTRGEIKSNVLSASTWHTPEEAVDEVSETLEASASALYQLIGKDFKDSFSKQDFEAAVAASGIDIDKVTVVEEPRIFGQNGEWAEAVLEIKTSDGRSQGFKVILRKEEGLWRIFGTEEL